MTISEFEQARINKVCAETIQTLTARIPVQGRHLLQYTITADGQNLYLYEVRAHFQDASHKSELPVAKLSYVQKTQTWKLFWHRASGKWQSYEPVAQSKRLEDLFAAILEDSYSCFFG